MFQWVWQNFIHLHVWNPAGQRLFRCLLSRDHLVLVSRWMILNRNSCHYYVECRGYITYVALLTSFLVALPLPLIIFNVLVDNVVQAWPSGGQCCAAIISRQDFLRSLSRNKGSILMKEKWKLVSRLSEGSSCNYWRLLKVCFVHERYVYVQFIW